MLSISSEDVGRVGTGRRGVVAVYCIKNRATGESYIGSSIAVYRRYLQHRLALSRHESRHPGLQKAWNNGTSDDFKFCILEIVKDVSKLKEREQFWIDSTESSYNINRFADSGRGRVLSVTTRRKIAESHIGKVLSRESIAKRSATLSKNIAENKKRGILPWNAGRQFLSPEKLREVAENNRGEKNAHARFTEEQVREIKRRAVAGEVQQRIADDFGVHQAVISRIKLGKAWSHVVI